MKEQELSISCNVRLCFELNNREKILNLGLYLLSLDFGSPLQLVGILNWFVVLLFNFLLWVFIYIFCYFIVCCSKLNYSLLHWLIFTSLSFYIHFSVTYLFIIIILWYFVLGYTFWISKLWRKLQNGVLKLWFGSLNYATHPYMFLLLRGMY